MPRTTPARNAIIGAAQGANAVLSAQIQALKLKQQKQMAMYEQFIERQKMNLQQEEIDVRREQIQAQRDIAAMKVEKGPYDLLKDSAATEVKLKGWDAVGEETKALLLGSAYDNYAKAKGIGKGGTGGGDDINTIEELSVQWGLGNVSDEALTRAFDAYMKLAGKSPRGEVFETIAGLIPKDRKERVLKEEIGGLKTYETISTPRSAAEVYSEALNLTNQAIEEGVYGDGVAEWTKRRLGIDTTLPEEEEEPGEQYGPESYLQSPETLDAEINRLRKKLGVP